MLRPFRRHVRKIRYNRRLWCAGEAAVIEVQVRVGWVDRALPAWLDYAVSLWSACSDECAPLEPARPRLKKKGLNLLRRQPWLRGSVWPSGATDSSPWLTSSQMSGVLPTQPGSPSGSPRHAVTARSGKTTTRPAAEPVLAVNDGGK